MLYCIIQCQLIHLFNSIQLIQTSILVGIDHSHVNLHYPNLAGYQNQEGAFQKNHFLGHTGICQLRVLGARDPKYQSVPESCPDNTHAQPGVGALP